MKKKYVALQRACFSIIPAIAFAVITIIIFVIHPDAISDKAFAIGFGIYLVTEIIWLAIIHFMLSIWKKS
jgi:drug/metabolite transporter superfamily protein YnfA